MLLSDDESDYVDQVTERSRRLIRTGIWEGISESRLDAWLGCLRNFDAELLAAYLLDNLFFRSRSQFFALLDSIFVDLQIPAADSLSGQISLVEGLQSGRSENPPTTGIRLAPVIGKFAPPTKSGPYILRLAQRRYRIHSDWLAWPQALADDQQMTHVYFVDDFCGTGRQFEKFIVGIEFDKFMQARRNVAVTYLVTTIHSEGLTYIRNRFPDVHVKWAERLSEANAVLDQACLSRYAVDNFSDRMALEYERAVRQAGLPTRGKIANGFGQLGLAYGFAHATPNNTLPIFWMGTPSLTPLLDR
jgi:hypothetical protein